MIAQINFIDTEGNMDGTDRIEVKLIRISPKYAEKISDAYEIYDKLWNGGESYATYEDFVEEQDENELIKEHFDELVEAETEEGWGVVGLCNIINALYPDAEASVIKSEVEVDCVY